MDMSYRIIFKDSDGKIYDIMEGTHSCFFRSDGSFFLFIRKATIECLGKFGSFTMEIKKA